MNEAQIDTIIQAFLLGGPLIVVGMASLYTASAALRFTSVGGKTIKRAISDQGDAQDWWDNPDQNRDR